MSLLPVLDAAAMREADRRTIESGLPGRELMEAAGRAACDAAEEAFGKMDGREVVVLCGRGNNGGDGFVVARILRGRGARVRAFTTGAPSTDDARANLDALEGLADDDDGLTVAPLDDARPLGNLHPDLVVDALLGTGSTGPLRDPYGALCAWMARQAAPVVALDVPTGLDASTGAAADGTVTARLTVTFAALKAGLLLGAGPRLAGEVVVAEIGIPAQVLADGAVAWRATDAWVAAHLPRRALDAHKYTAGRVLAIAGSRAFTGAAALATGAAYRAGAGAVVCCTPRSAAPTLDALRVEVMVDPQPETDDGTLAIMAYDAIVERLKAADAAVVGCGLGKTVETQRFVRALLRRLPIPTVLDADGLSSFAGHADKLADASAPLVLTPHTGELARLLGEEAPDLSDRLGLVRTLAARWDAVLLLKGMPSVVAAPDGRVFIGPPPQPALATAGTGDVLAGTIAGLLAQGTPPFEAAVAALHVGSAAAEWWGRDRAPEALLASDLPALYPYVLHARFGPPAAPAP